MQSAFLFALFLSMSAPTLVSGVAAPGPSMADYKAGKAAEKDAAAAAAAKDAKMAAVNKVIFLMEDLQAQVMKEGEEEAASYNKFACFCKDTSAEKTETISKGDAEKTALISTITNLGVDRDNLDTTITNLNTDIETAEETIKTAKAFRAKTFKAYEINAADLTAAIAALESAIEVLKSSKAPTLVQLQSVGKTVRRATLMADALGLKGAQAAATFFLQQDQPEVEMEDYKFHSKGIIDTLEGLLKDFRAEKVTVDEEEVKSKAAFDALLQEQTDILKAKNLALEDAKKEKAGKIEEIGENSEELTTVSAVLIDDQLYLKELSQMCVDRAKTWDQRTSVRADELSALTAAIAIIKSTVAEKTQASTLRFAQQGVSVRLAEAVARDPASMNAVEAAAEAADDAAPAFLQRGSLRSFLAKRHTAPENDGGRQAVITLLQNQGQKLHSTLLVSLATQIAADPFAKIKKLIQELIERLLQEAANEANQKGWCDKATADAEQKRDYAADDIEELNGSLASLEALRDKLLEEIATLQTEIWDLETKQSEAEAMRADEKAENAFTVSEAEAGLDAVNMAIKILFEFYATVKKAKVSYAPSPAPASMAERGLASVPTLIQQGPMDDAPDAGFDAKEAYTGSQGESGGILGMLDVIKSDFERTIAETEKAEEESAKDHLVFMTETSKSLAEKNMAKDEKTKQKDDAVSKISDDNGELDTQTSILQTAIKELLELKAACVDTGMSYEDRVAKREEEIEGLKKALCILQSYAEYGPEGAADQC